MRDAEPARRGPSRGGGPDPAERERLILEHLPLVQALAWRYANRGEPVDDLVQVGTVGLIKAVDRYDPALGNALASFATPTILGEIRRHFRDRSWTVRVPRAVQEARASIASAIDELSSRLGRSPSVREIAAEAGLSEDEVLDALAAASAHRPSSLSGLRDPDAAETGVDVPVDEEGFARAEARVTIAEGLRALPPRERVILHLRFEEGLTQSEIAARVGVSQMHVSRLLRRSLGMLRAGAAVEAGGEPEADRGRKRDTPR
jgi:RNA polymerase sigma-B factor